MPKLVDYAGRFAFIRQAAFDVVRDRGVDALTRRSLALELGCSVNTVTRLVNGSTVLAKLAADEVVSRRRQGRWGSLPQDPLQQSLVLLRRLIPDDESRIDEELVWLRLVATCGLQPSVAPGQLRLADDFQVAQRGYSDADLAIEAGAAPPERPHTGEVQERRRAALAPHLSSRDTEVEDVVLHVVAAAAARRASGDERVRSRERVLLRALLDGLSLAVCTGRITPADAVGALDQHLTGLHNPLG